MTALSNLKKSFGWLSLTLLFGLAPMWIITMIDLYKGQNPLIYLIVKGEILFFSIVLISSLVIDYFLFEERTIGFFHRLIFSIIPLIVITLCAILLVICYFDPELKQHPDFEHRKIQFLFLSQIVILIITAFYAVFVKFDHLKSLEHCKIHDREGIRS